MTLYVFNPEHDLCLANGDRNYVPPESALCFAHDGKDAMRTIYGADAYVVAADEFGLFQSQNPNMTVSSIVPWGWDLRLKQCLLKQGAAPSLLPSDSWLEQLRQLQHRSTILSLQPHAVAAYSVDDVERQLAVCPSLVLKAPWSGSGRGIKWVERRLLPNDETWIEKTVASQRCVMVERRMKVKADFAIEYNVRKGVVTATGLSLFTTQSGVYRHNIMISDDEIRLRVGLSGALESKLLQWLQTNIAPHYEGPCGIDLIAADDGKIYVCELNLRHTMGMVAHSKMMSN